MKIKEEDICTLIKKDKQMVEILKIVKSLNLNDWWIGAGFVRNKVWNHLHNFKDELVSDIDVIYFDKTNIEECTEKEIEEKLKHLSPELPWSVKNQARMHIRNNDKEYASSVSALSRWPETATSIAVTLNENNEIILAAPHGINDLVNLRVVPTPAFHNKRDIYEERQLEKKWRNRWYKLKIFHFKNTE